MNKDINKGKKKDADKIKDYKAPLKSTPEEEAIKYSESVDDADKVKDYEGPKQPDPADLPELPEEPKDTNGGDTIVNTGNLPLIERKVNRAGKLILQINDYRSDLDFTDLSMETNDAIYLNLKDPVKIKDLISKIRFSDLRNVYLIPLFLSGVPTDYRPGIIDLCDGVYTNINEKQLILTANKINSVIIQLKEISEKNYEKKVLYKLIRYMFTRDYSLQPYIYPFTTQGYVYPFLDIHYKGDIFKDKRQTQILEEGEKAGLLKSEFVDKVHLCPQCHAGFHNFKELCPKCDSPNLKSEPLIHHFVCANVGPERDYKKADLLFCPKCDKELRHIGVDYDRPSTIFECNDCGEFFQDPNIKALCFNCKTQNNVEDLLAKDIKTYSITKYGVGIVKASLFHDEYAEDIFYGCYSYNVFKELLGQELKRVKNLKTGAICGNIQIAIHNVDKLSREVIDNIYITASKALTDSAVSLCHFEDLFIFVMPYGKHKEATKIIEDITSAAKKAIKDSFNDVECNINTKIIDIKIDDVEDELLNQIILI